MFLVVLVESKLWTVEGHLAESTWREAFGGKLQRQYADVMSYLHTRRKSSYMGLVKVIKPVWPTYMALLVLHPVSETSEMAAYGDNWWRTVPLCLYPMFLRHFLQEAERVLGLNSVLDISFCSRVLRFWERYSWGSRSSEMWRCVCYRRFEGSVVSPSPSVEMCRNNSTLLPFIAEESSPKVLLYFSCCV